jgi:hypothetical protein
MRRIARIEASEVERGKGSRGKQPFKPDSYNYLLLKLIRAMRKKSREFGFDKALYYELWAGESLELRYMVPIGNFRLQQVVRL